MEKPVGIIARIIVGLIALIILLAGGVDVDAVTIFTSENFNHQNWGSYYTLPYAGEQYFVGYSDGTTISKPTTNVVPKLTFDATSNSGQLHKILMNDNVARTLNKGEILYLGEGYQFKIHDHWNEGNLSNPGSILINLLRNGWVYDSTSISKGETYVYTFKAGDISDLPVIVAHVSDVSSASITFDGIFQISDGFIKVTDINGSISYVTVTPAIPAPRTPTPTPTPTKGYISVSSSPSGASIYLDSAYQGVTPKTITDASIGTHYLEIKLEDYKPWSDSIEVRADSTSYISIQLTSTPSPTTPASTPTLTPAITVTENPTPTLTFQLEQEVNEIKDRSNKTEEKQNQQESRISWLESAINSIINWLKSI